MIESNNAIQTGRLPKTGNLSHNLGLAAQTGALLQPDSQHEAQSLWLGVQQLAEEAEGHDPLRLAQFLDQLAKIYEANGDQARAIRLYERLTRLVEKTGCQCELNRWRLHAWRRMAALQQAQGRNGEAGQLLQNA